MKIKELATAKTEEKFAEKLKEVQLTPELFQYFIEVLLDVWVPYCLVCQKGYKTKKAFARSTNTLEISKKN